MSALAVANFEAPEWTIDKDEADELGKAVQTVTDLYTDVKLPAEAIAWGNLALVMGRVFGPRIYMTMERLKAERARDVTPRPGPLAPAPAAPPPVVQPATPEFAAPAFTAPEVDVRPQAPSPPTSAELNKALFPDEFKF